jgi:hypothetical protein
MLGPFGTAAITDLLYLPRVIVMMEKLVEWTVLAGETEVLGENLPRRHFVHHKSRLSDPGANPGSQRLTASAMARPCCGKLQHKFHPKYPEITATESWINVRQFCGMAYAK